MKHLSYYILVFAFISFLGSCDNPNENKSKKVDTSTEKGIANLTFEKTEHYFGTVIDGEKVTYSFRFTNTGNADLKLTSVGASCGCTATDYPLEPIKPGETGKIKVSFDSSHRLGMQNKKVTVRSNSNPEFISLNIYAQVVEKNSEN
jgi:hypothetical protein